MNSIPLTVPDLDAPGTAATVGEWLAREGDAVVEGDRLVELVYGEIVVELPAPASGTLIQALRGERTVRPGELLGRIALDPDG